jgi:hypothetical protein
VIHIKDYIKKSEPSKESNSNSISTENNLVDFSKDDEISEEYIGRFVDKLMKMPEDLHLSPSYCIPESNETLDLVASRILSDEQW